MKVTAFLLLLVLGYCAASSLRICQEGETKKYLGGTSFEISGQFLQKIIKYIDLPDIGFYPSAIDCVIVDDQASDETSGEVSIVEGGISFNYTKFKFTSNIGGGLKYKIDLYTKA